MPYKKQATLNADGSIVVVALYKENGDDWAACGQCTITPEEMGEDFVGSSVGQRKQRIKEYVDTTFEQLVNANEEAIKPPPPTHEEYVTAISEAIDLEELND